MGKRFVLIICFCFLLSSMTALAAIGWATQPIYDKATDRWFAGGYAGGNDVGSVMDWYLYKYFDPPKDGFHWCVVDAGWLEADGMYWRWGYGGLESGMYMLYIVPRSGSPQIQADINVK